MPRFSRSSAPDGSRAKSSCASCSKGRASPSPRRRCPGISAISASPRSPPPTGAPTTRRPSRAAPASAPTWSSSSPRCSSLWTGWGRCSWSRRRRAERRRWVSRSTGRRGRNMDSMPLGWQVVDATLKLVKPAADIITTEKFRNFELSLEWNIAKNGNSGIFYRASEDRDYNAIYWSAPEMQVLDDAGHPDGQSRLTAAGADYGLYPSPAGVVKPAGQWNAVRLVVNGNHVEHWLNGVKVVEYELGSPEWEAKVKCRKLASHPHYGRNAEGYIGLQEHEYPVAFRNIKIRVLP